MPDPEREAAPARRRRPSRAQRSRPPFKRPDRRRVRRIAARLRDLYGEKRNRPHRDPVHELVLTILSQNTSDRNRDVAYARLRERFGSWRQVREADAEEVREAIRPGGLAQTKGPRIQEVLRLIDEDDLAWLDQAPREQAIDFLTALPGVGRKTAACVLMFSFDRAEIPVDTHVHRVGGRLGLFDPAITADAAHDEINRVSVGEDPYELHMNLIAHGRRVCRPVPRCEQCALRRMCPWWREHPGRGPDGGIS